MKLSHLSVLALAFMQSSAMHSGKYLDDTSMTTLLNAIKSADMNTLDRCISNGDLLRVDNHVLISAGSSGDPDVVQKVLDARPCWGNEEKVFEDAVEMGHVDIARTLAPHINTAPKPFVNNLEVNHDHEYLDEVVLDEFITAVRNSDFPTVRRHIVKGHLQIIDCFILNAAYESNNLDMFRLISSARTYWENAVFLFDEAVTRKNLKMAKELARFIPRSLNRTSDTMKRFLNAVRTQNICSIQKHLALGHQDDLDDQLLNVAVATGDIPTIRLIAGSRSWDTVGKHFAEACSENLFDVASELIFYIKVDTCLDFDDENKINRHTGAVDLAVVSMVKYNYPAAILSAAVLAAIRNDNPEFINIVLNQPGVLTNLDNDQIFHQMKLAYTSPNSSYRVKRVASDIVFGC